MESASFDLANWPSVKYIIVKKLATLHKAEFSARMKGWWSFADDGQQIFTIRPYRSGDQFNAARVQQQLTILFRGITSVDFCVDTWLLQPLQKAFIGSVAHVDYYDKKTYVLTMNGYTQDLVQFLHDNRGHLSEALEMRKDAQKEKRHAHIRGGKGRHLVSQGVTNDTNPFAALDCV